MNTLINFIRIIWAGSNQYRIGYIKGKQYTKSLQNQLKEKIKKWQEDEKISLRDAIKKSQEYIFDLALEDKSKQHAQIVDYNKKNIRYLEIEYKNKLTDLQISHDAQKEKLKETMDALKNSYKPNEEANLQLKRLIVAIDQEIKKISEERAMLRARLDEVQKIRLGKTDSEYSRKKKYIFRETLLGKKFRSIIQELGIALGRIEDSISALLLLLLSIIFILIDYCLFFPIAKDMFGNLKIFLNISSAYITPLFVIGVLVAMLHIGWLYYDKTKDLRLKKIMENSIIAILVICIILMVGFSMLMSIIPALFNNKLSSVDLSDLLRAIALVPIAFIAEWFLRQSENTYYNHGFGYLFVIPKAIIYSLISLIIYFFGNAVILLLNIFNFLIGRKLPDLPEEIEINSKLQSTEKSQKYYEEKKMVVIQQLQQNVNSALAQHEEKVISLNNESMAISASLEEKKKELQLNYDDKIDKIKLVIKKAEEAMAELKSGCNDGFMDVVRF